MAAYFGGGEGCRQTGLQSRENQYRLEASDEFTRSRPLNRTADRARLLVLFYHSLHRTKPAGSARNVSALAPLALE
jgi:hypothetical protein